jgi:hypothetical protein
MRAYVRAYIRVCVRTHEAMGLCERTVTRFNVVIYFVKSRFSRKIF